MKKLFTTLILMLVLVLGGRITCVAQTYGTNLVINGDAELDFFNPWPWTASGLHASAFVVANAYYGEEDQEIHGNVLELYDGSANVEATFSQTINISDIQSTVATGLVSLDFSVQAFSWYGANASYTVYELDVSDNVLSTHTSGNINLLRQDVNFNINPSLSNCVWTTTSFAVASLNTSTAKLRISVYGKTSNTAEDFVDFDNIQLVLSTVPSVITTAISTYNATSATMGGNVTSENGATVTERGVVYSSTDATPTIDDTDVTKNANGTGTGSFGKSITGLSGNTTYYVCAYATNIAGTNYGTVVSFKTPTPGTWTGNASSSRWTDAGNWSDNQVPTATTDVTVPSSGITYLPMIFATDNAECNNLTVADGNLEILSSSSGTGSLIIHGTASGRVWTDVYLTAAQWHIVAPPSDDADISSFISNSSNGISQKVDGATTTYAIGDYNEGSNAWKSYFTNSTSGTFESGNGYIMRRDNSDYVSFYGNLITGTKTVTLTKTGSEGWNSIGNPYTSAIGMNSSAGTASNFLGVNASSSLDQNYACVYVWDPTSSSYKIIGGLPSGLGSERSLGQSLLQSGQGFFVKAKEAGSLISFTLAMQTHSTETALKSAETTWPGFELTASASGVKASTVVAFNEKMTKGLDPTYDAGLLRGTNGLSLYTKLIDDNGVDFAIQCLPESGMESFVIPVGLDAKAGSEVKLSATTIGLPTGSSVILEDRIAKVYTDLSNGDEYAVTLSANSSGTGRFYIHTSYLTTGTSGLLPTAGFSLKAYPANGIIWIEGQVSNSAKAYLFSIGGSKLGVFNLQEGSRNSIPANGLATGVYLLKVTDGSKQFNTKIVLN